ncbi:MAG: hypothetical protein IJ488_06235 [Clostridia bacterium]|nr:hypothetical protein [Clostridia bacterium]
MEERKSKELYTRAWLDVVILNGADIITASGPDVPTSSGGELDSNWDVNS